MIIKEQTHKEQEQRVVLLLSNHKAPKNQNYLKFQKLESPKLLIKYKERMLMDQVKMRFKQHRD